MLWTLFNLLGTGWALEWIMDPSCYFAVKNIEGSVGMGLMWGGEYKLNHEMTEDHVHLDVVAADPGKFYIQKAFDSKLLVEITQTWSVSETGWEMSFEGVHKAKHASQKEKMINLVFFIALSNDTLEYQNGQWTGTFPFSLESSSDVIVRALKTRDIHEKSWKVKKFVQKWLFDSHSAQKAKYGALEPASEPESNFIFIQVQSTSPFQVKLRYGSPQSFDSPSSLQTFSNKILSSFGAPTSFTSATLSYLLSGLSLLSGPIKIKQGKETTPGMDKTLLTFVPSRSSFPRGFLWDEGFHLLVVEHWDLALAVKVFVSWMHTIDESGWIPREQIRGPAAETRVPEQFIPQSRDVANPPTFVFFIEDLIERIEATDQDSRSLLDEYKALALVYEKLKKWHSWLSAGQRNKEELPMWKGRSFGHNLASGLDDYPRGLTVSENERHLDLYMWEIKFTQVMNKLANLLELNEDSLIFSKHLKKLQSFDSKFLEDSVYKDYMSEQFLTEDLKQAYLWRGDNKCSNVLNPLGTPAECNPYSDMPCCSEFGWCGNTPGHCDCAKCKKAKKLENRENLQKKQIFSPHVGYVNLMPLIVGHVQAGSRQFESILNFIEDPGQLWSDFGLRSLSKADLLFKSGENYWKGNIWVNFNYMVLRAIRRDYWECERAQGIYKRLRGNLVRNIEKVWNSTGYLWEQYDEATGHGLRVHPFTGWSSLIVNIYYEKF